MGLVLLIDPWAKNVEFSGGVALEVRGGFAPLQPGGSSPSEPTIRISLAPTGVLVYRDRVRIRELRLEYSPQALYRWSERYAEVSQLNRPLVFHQMSASYGASLSPRVSWYGGLGGNIGEMDYSLQSAQLGNTSAPDGSTPETGDGGTPQDPVAQPSDVPVLRTGGLSGSVGLTGRVTPLHSFSISPSFTVQRLLTEIPSDPMSGGTGFTLNQTSAALSISHQGVISRIDSITTTATGGYADFSTNGSQAFTSGAVAWSRRLRPRLDSRLTGGVFFTRQVIVPLDGNGEERAALGIPLLPTVNYSLTGRVYQRAKLQISTNVNAGTQAYFDAVQGSVLPLAGGGFSVNFLLPPDLTIGLTGSYYTPPTAPNVTDANSPAAGRSALSLSTPVTYQIRRNLSMAAGTIFTGRGPHISLIDASGPFPIREYWVYVSFRVAFAAR